MLHTNCHALHFTLPSDANIQKNAVCIYVQWNNMNVDDLIGYGHILLN